MEHHEERRITTVEKERKEERGERECLLQFSILMYKIHCLRGDEDL